MGEFCMPSLGSDMEDGTLIEWEKHTGDAVHRGDVIAVVETQKGAIEIEVYEDGVIENVLVSVGAKVPVGTPLALIGDGSAIEQTSDTDSAELSSSKPIASVQAGSQARPATLPGAKMNNQSRAASVDQIRNTEAASKTPADTQRSRVTPAARQLALVEQVDLKTLVGTGPDSAIVLDDVRSAIDTIKRAPSTSTNELESKSDQSQTDVATTKVSASSMDGMRAAIATAMSRSKREIPHYYLSHTVDVDIALAYISATNAEKAPQDRFVPGALFIRSVALAARQYPEFNGHFENEMYTASDAVNIGMAINIRGGGLVAPAIHNADELNIEDTMASLKDLVARVRKGRFKASELSDPTLTVSSLGDRGVDSLYGVIYPPQVAIVGFGTPTKTVDVRDGDIVPTTTVTITLAADHRVSDGHRGSLFLRAIERNLQQPEELK